MVNGDLSIGGLGPFHVTVAGVRIGQHQQMIFIIVWQQLK
jgi:hypothetical protein